MILGSLDEQDRKILLDALDDESVGHRTIERVLTDEGIRPPTGGVGKHRRRECRCYAT